MANSIGKLALALEVDTDDFTRGLGLSRAEMKVHRQALLDAATPADELAAAERRLATLMEKAPKHAEAYAKAVAGLRAEMEAEAKAVQAAADAEKAATEERARRVAEVEQAKAARAAEIAQAKADRQAEIAQAKAERLAEAEQRKQDRAVEIAALRLDRANDIAEQRKIAEQSHAIRASEIAQAKAERLAEQAARRQEAEQAATASRAQQIISRDQTAGERYAASLRELHDLRQKNALTAEQHARAVAREAAEMRAATATQKNGFDGLLASVTPANLAITGMATVTASLTAAAYGLARGLQDAIARIDETADKAANYGVAADKLDRLQKAAYLADAPIELMGTLLDKVQTKASEAASGEQAAVQAFTQIGMSVKDVKDLAPDQLFERVAVRIGELKPTDQIRSMKDLFGKSAGEAGNLIRNYRQFADEVDRAGLALTPEKFAAINQVDDATKRLSLSWQSLADTLATDIAPPLTAIVEELTGATDQTREAVGETTTLRDVLYDVRDAIATTRDNWESIVSAARAVASVTQMISNPAGMLGRGVSQGADIDALRAEQRAIEQITREENAAAAAAKQRGEAQQQAALRRALIAPEKPAAASKGPDELERLLQARRDEIELIERGKAAVEIDKAVRLGAQEAELAMLDELRRKEEMLRDERDRETIHRQAVLSLIDRAIAAQERLITPQERLNRLIEEQAELVNAGMLAEADAMELVRREAAQIKAEQSSGVAVMQAGSQAFVAATARREGQEQQTELQRRSLEELKKLVKKPATEIVVMKAGA